MSLVRLNPFRTLTTLEPDNRNFFGEFFGDFLTHPVFTERDWLPRVDLRDTKDNVELTAELPGMKKEDIKVTYENGLLTISGERKREEKEENNNYFCGERRFGNFSRSFRLPEEVQTDKIKANYKDGVLHISLPKVEAKKPQEIQISSN